MLVLGINNLANVACCNGMVQWLGSRRMLVKGNASSYPSLDGWTTITF